MAFIDLVPTHHKALKITLGKTYAELGAVSRELEIQDYGDEWFYHDCDCEYCDISDSRKDTKRMSDTEIAEAKAKEAELQGQVAELKKTIRGLEGYAKMYGQPLPTGDLLK